MGPDTFQCGNGRKRSCIGDSISVLAGVEANSGAGLKVFYEVGAALLEIRDMRLYRQDFGTFEDYCFERWNLKERRAYQLMDAVSVIDNLESCTMVQLPDNERQIRELTPLNDQPELQRQIWNAVLEIAPPQ